MGEITVVPEQEPVFAEATTRQARTSERRLKGDGFGATVLLSVNWDSIGNHNQ